MSSIKPRAQSSVRRPLLLLHESLVELPGTSIDIVSIVLDRSKYESSLQPGLLV